MNTRTRSVIIGGTVAAAVCGGGLPAPAAFAGQQVVNPDRCAAQGGAYTTSGTSRSCTVTTSGAPQQAYQLIDGPFDAVTTGASFQLVSYTDTTTTTTGPSTKTTAVKRLVILGAATCAQGTVLAILSGTGTAVVCPAGLPDLSNTSNPIFIVS